MANIVPLTAELYGNRARMVKFGQHLFRNPSISVLIILAIGCQGTLMAAETREQMPTPIGLSYLQVGAESATLTWNAGAALPEGADLQYQLQYLGDRFRRLGDFLPSGHPRDLDGYLLREDTSLAKSYLWINLPTPFQKSLASDGFMWTGWLTGRVDGQIRALPMIPGAPMWNRVDATYAVSIGAPMQLPALGAGVIPDGSETPVTTLTDDEVDHINWSAVRVRAVDRNGIYMPSDWSDMFVGYGVHLEPGYAYRQQ